MRTEDFIVELAGRAEPVRPLSSHSVRLASWLALAIACASAAILFLGVRLDAATVFSTPAFLQTGIVAAAAAAVAAAAALILAIPGAERTPALRTGALGLIALWAGFLGTAIIRGGHGFALASDWPVCFARVALIAAVPAAGLFLMVRRAAPLRPAWTGGLAAVAAASIGGLAIQFVCPNVDPGHAWLGHFSPILMLGALGAVAGRRLTIQAQSSRG